MTSVIPLIDVSAVREDVIALDPDVAASGDRVYVDIAYSSPAGGRIQFHRGSVGANLLQGGPRVLSLELPRAAFVDGGLPCRIAGQFDLISVHVRRNFYDFFNLNAAEENRRVLEVAKQRSAQIPVSIQWFVTWHCNYSCEYCWQEVEADKYRVGSITKVEPERWAEAFNRLEPAEIYLTGGEPSLYKPLPKLISLLDPSIELVMHSNLGGSLSLEHFMDHVKLDRFKELTFSFHPSQIGFDEFFDKMERLAKAGFQNLKVEMVLYPRHLPYAQRVYEWCEKHRIELRFDPYTPAKISMLQRTPEDIEQMKFWTRKAGELVHALGRDEVYEFDSKQYWDSDHLRNLDLRQPVYCGAGSRRINVDGAGDAFTCMSAIDRTKLFGDKALPHYASIGNVLDEDFALLSEPIACWEAFRCSACDFQVLDRGWVNLERPAAHLPIPE